MKGHLAADKNDIKVTKRMTPEIVVASGGAESASPPDFKPDIRSYTLLYRIWGSHQRLHFQNKNMGYLEIDKKTSGDTVVFNINKKIVNHDNLNQHMHMELVVLNDYHLTPVSFKYSSEITDNAMCVRPELSLLREGEVLHGYVIESINGTRYKRIYEGRPVFDSTIYDFIMRDAPFENFTYMENLYAFKTGSSLKKVNKDYVFDNGVFNLYVQRGVGYTESNYYSGNTGVPLMMIQNSVAYILDFNAKEAIDELIGELNTGGVHYEY